MRAKVLRTVSLLGDSGPGLREPYSKPLDDGIFEIRTKFGSDITRVLYFFVVGKKGHLNELFYKKSRKKRHGQKLNWLKSTEPIIFPERRIPNDKL